ncbi:UNVERIFIED_CONTAM: b-cell receptor-associated protein [Gekko kuhli]
MCPHNLKKLTATQFQSRSVAQFPPHQDAIREIRKYDDVTEKVNLQNNPGAVEHFHMKLFRAQRNLYIAGFSLLMSL